MTVRLERTWQADDVERELREAVELVERIDPADDLRLAVFNYAAQLLTQRTVQQVGGVLLGAPQLPPQ